MLTNRKKGLKVKDMQKLDRLVLDTDTIPSGMHNCVKCGKPTRSHYIDGKFYCHVCFVNGQDASKKEV